MGEYFHADAFLHGAAIAASMIVAIASLALHQRNQKRQSAFISVLAAVLGAAGFAAFVSAFVALMEAIQ